MSAPRRIQRKRTKGWRMPEGAVYVGRPSVWGNPFPLDGDWITWAAIGFGYRGDAPGRRGASVALFRSWLTNEPLVLGPDADKRDGGVIEFSSGHSASVAEHARGIAVFATTLYEPPKLREAPSVKSLRGRDLACYCPLSQICHADVLLEIANAPSLAGVGT